MGDNYEALLREAWDKGYLKAKHTSDSDLHQRLADLFDQPPVCEHCDGRGIRDAHQTGDGYGGTCPHCDGQGRVKPKVAVRTKKGFYLHVSEHRNTEGICVQVLTDRLSEEESLLSFKMSPEGLVVDHIDEDGNVIKTFSSMWEELEGLLK